MTHPHPATRGKPLLGLAMFGDENGLRQYERGFRDGAAAIEQSVNNLGAGTYVGLMSGEMVAVPKEPTEAMLLAGNRKLCDRIECSCDEDGIFRAMLSAATAGLSEDKT